MLNSQALIIAGSPRMTRTYWEQPLNTGYIFYLTSMSSAAAAEAALQQLGVTRDQAVEFHRLSIQGNRLLHASLTLLVYDFGLT
ncbi:hypothetical protein FRC18_005778, partial [Serendipita sp. 400]